MKKHMVTIEGRGDICSRSTCIQRVDVSPGDVEDAFEAELMAALADSELVKTDALVD